MKEVQRNFILGIFGFLIPLCSIVYLILKTSNVENSITVAFVLLGTVFVVNCGMYLFLFSHTPKEEPEPTGIQMINTKEDDVFVDVPL